MFSCETLAQFERPDSSYCSVLVYNWCGLCKIYIDSNNMGIVVLVPCINLIASKNTLLSVKRCRWPFVFDVFPFFCVINLYTEIVWTISVKKRKKTFVDNIFLQGTDTANRQEKRVCIHCVHMYENMYRVGVKREVWCWSNLFI